MRKSWQCGQIEVLKSRVSPEEYELSVDELAELIYKYICQLQSELISTSKTFTVPSVHESEVADAA